MFNCQCGKPVRAIYCPDENQHEPDSVCQDCHEADRYLQQLYAIKKNLERDLLDCALSLASLEQEIREKEAIAHSPAYPNAYTQEDDLPF